MNSSPERIAELQAFIEHALSLPGVWFVTGQQLIDWVQNPVPVDKVSCSLAVPGNRSSYYIHFLGRALLVNRPLMFEGAGVQPPACLQLEHAGSQGRVHTASRHVEPNPSAAPALPCCRSTSRAPLPQTSSHLPSSRPACRHAPSSPTAFTGRGTLAAASAAAWERALQGAGAGILTLAPVRP